MNGNAGALSRVSIEDLRHRLRLMPAEFLGYELFSRSTLGETADLQKSSVIKFQKCSLVNGICCNGLWRERICRTSVGRCCSV
jgi:hypothetical protein